MTRESQRPVSGAVGASGSLAPRPRLSRLILVTTVAFVLASLVPTQALAEEPCEFRLGFATLREAIIRTEGRDVVGACLEDERYDLRGNAAQRTSAGKFTWRKADNSTQFKAGRTTWTATLKGVEKHAKAKGKGRAKGLGKGHHKSHDKGKPVSTGNGRGKALGKLKR